MLEKGIVKEIIGEEVKLEMIRNAACGSCKACSIGIDSTVMELRALNRCRAQVGDTVEIQLENQEFLSAVGILYGIPLILLLVGLGIGAMLGKVLSPDYAELIAVAVGFLFVFFGFLGVKKQSERISKERYVPKAIRVIQQGF